MRFLLLLCLSSLLLSAVFTQTLTVVDSTTNKPIELATIMSQDPTASAYTNAKGQASVAGFRGDTLIAISALGYKTKYISYGVLEKIGFVVSLKATAFRLDEVVMTGNRWRQNSKNVPAKIVSISSREVALHNPQTAADLLGLSGKVFIQKSQQGGGSPMIRGFATNRLIYTVDGVRMNTAIFRSGNIQNVINIDPFATEHTEVLFGPGSVIYGSDAIGGVMSFQTLDAELSLGDSIYLKGKAITRYASANNEITGHFDVNVGWEKWALVTSFSHWDYGDLRQGSRGPDDYIKPWYVQRQDSTDRVIQQENPLIQRPSAYSQFNLMQKVRFKPAEHWDFIYGFHYSRTSPFGRYDRHSRLRNDQPRYAEWSYGPQLWLMNNLHINHKRELGLFDRLSLRLAHQSFEESRISRQLNQLDRSTQEERVAAYSANLDFIKSFSNTNSLFYGLEFVHNDVSSLGSIRQINEERVRSGPARYPDAGWTSIAAYINDEIKLGKRATLQAGLRYNLLSLKAGFSNNEAFFPLPQQNSSRHSSALTGSIGAVYRPDKNWIMKASIGTAFRAPNVDDLGKVFDAEPGAVLVPNAGLNPEYAWNADMSLTKVFGDHIKVDIAAYYTYLDQALVRRNFQLDGQDSIRYLGVLSQVQAIQNAAVARVYGIQGGIEVKLPAGFSFSTDINLQQGEEELDDGNLSPSRHAAPFFGQSRLSLHVKDLRMQLYAQYQGGRSHEQLAVGERRKVEIYALDENGNPFAPSWYTLNLKVLHPLSDIFTISAGVENITDRRYRPYSSGISGAGRNFILSLTAKY